MTKTLFLATFLLSSLPLAACNKPASQADGTAATATAAATAAAAVKAVEAEMLAAFATKDAAKLISQYASDAVLALPGRTVKGTEEITKAYTQDLADPAFSLAFVNDKTDVAASADLAYTSGTFNVSSTNPQTKAVEKVAGTYVTVFRKQADGSWKAVADIATPGAPPAAAAAPPA
ncbi:SgcJ/EcaC family oxidoreductase [Sphingomonas sp.]|uniref:YybH family protein n=1 Tax=Sphingomonas sp. TaxID=28214 RepID=UPI00286C0FB1|nr:SgcJ/EcaC family oxidoreductase [Sphingomonas sp.]